MPPRRKRKQNAPDRSETFSMRSLCNYRCALSSGSNKRLSRKPRYCSPWVCDRPLEESNYAESTPMRNARMAIGLKGSVVDPLLSPSPTLLVGVLVFPIHSWKSVSFDTIANPCFFAHSQTTNSSASFRPTALMCVESGKKSATREIILSERFSSNSSFTPAPRRASARGRPQRRSKH